MTDIVERLRMTANCGIPDFTNSKLLDEVADEIERLRNGAGYELLADTLVKRDAEIERLRERVAELQAELGYTESIKALADQKEEPNAAS